MKNKKLFFTLGVVLTIIGIINALIAVFAFRDFSFPLFLMFLIATLIYPYGIYLIIRNRPSFKEVPKVDKEKQDIKKSEMYESD